MYIEHEDIRRFKRMNLADVFTSYGHALKRTRTGFTANCPFHKDTDHSLSINRKNDVWLWHCRVCRIGGSVIDFIMRKESLSLKESYLKLKDMLDKPSEPAPSSDTSRVKLMGYIADYCEGVLRNSAEAKRSLEKLKLASQDILKNFKIGYSDGTLTQHKLFMPDFKKLGILNRNNDEVLKGHVIVPLEGTDKNVIGLSAIKENKELHIGEGIFNARVFKASKRIYITERVLDALALYRIGIYEVTSLGKDRVLTKTHIRYMKDTLTSEIILAVKDESCLRKTSETIVKELNLEPSYLAFPEKTLSVHEWLLQGLTKKDILSNIKPLPETHRKTHPPREEKPHLTVREKATDLYFDFEDRSYRVRGVEFDKVSTLRANIKLTSKKGAHLDTFDLTSSMSRERFKRMAKRLLDIDERLIHKDLASIIDKLEDIQSKHLEEKNKKVSQAPRRMTDDDKEKALDLLRDGRLLDRIVEDFHRSGYVGEDANLLMGYLVATSRLLENPLSLLLISRSSAGKTSLQDAILSFMPEEDVIKYTRLTDQSLFYHEEDSLYKKVLAIEEEEGALGAGYAIRNVLTTKALKTGSTIKDPETGQLKNQNTRVKVQTSVFLTTTRHSLDSETINRFVIATIDESEPQTGRILAYQRRLYGKEGFHLRKERSYLESLHKNAQRLIEPVDIVNPYEDSLTFTTKTLRARREQVKYLTLINTVALLRQHQKDLKRRKDRSSYIEVDLFDIEIANKLAKAYLTKNLEHISPPARNLYKELQKMILSKAKEHTSQEAIVSRRDIMEYTGWSEWQVRTHINELVELEYVIPVQGKQGKRYSYRLAEDVGFELPTVDIGLSTPKKEADPSFIENYNRITRDTTDVLLKNFITQ